MSPGFRAAPGRGRCVHASTLPLIGYDDKDGIAGRGRGRAGSGSDDDDDDGERGGTWDGTAGRRGDDVETDGTRNRVAGRGGDDVEGTGDWLATKARTVARRWKRMVRPLRNLVFDVS